MKYNVDDVRTLMSDVKEVEANSSLEAARKAFPNLKIVRSKSQVGDIVVGRYTKQWYGRGYRTYVYRIEGVING